MSCFSERWPQKQAGERRVPCGGPDPNMQTGAHYLRQGRHGIPAAAVSRYS